MTPLWGLQLGPGFHAHPSRCLENNGTLTPITYDPNNSWDSDPNNFDPNNFNNFSDPNNFSA